MQQLKVRGRKKVQEKRWKHVTDAEKVEKGKETSDIQERVCPPGASVMCKRAFKCWIHGVEIGCRGSVWTVMLSH